jgi:hypothetical protein
MIIKKFESFLPSERPKKESLEDLVDKEYKSQSIHLNSDEIRIILRILKNNVDRLESKGMARMAKEKELMLKNILSKLN